MCMCFELVQIFVTFTVTYVAAVVASKYLAYEITKFLNNLWCYN